MYERGPIVYAPQRLTEVPRGVRLEVMWDAGGVDLEAMMKDLGSRGVVDLLVEGGATLARSLVRSNLVDRFVFYLAGKVAGGTGRPMFEGAFPTLGAARRLDITSVRTVGPDVRVEATPDEGDA